MSALEADQVWAGYPGRGPVLRGASLALPTGVRVALLGANGSGKTTLLRCLSGAHRPDRGRVLRAGKALGYGAGDLRAHRAHVQLVLQNPDDQLFSADVHQDVSFGPLNLGWDHDEVRRRVAEALDVLGITHLAERATHQLSYGERKRVATAGAVAMRPGVLLLDEPTAGLDPEGVHEMLAALERLIAADTTVLMATHDVDLALAWADVAAVVADGVVTQGAPVDVLDDTELLARARLRRPWPLELASRLDLRAVDGSALRPRHLDDIAPRDPR